MTKIKSTKNATKSTFRQKQKSRPNYSIWHTEYTLVNSGALPLHHIAKKKLPRPSMFLYFHFKVNGRLTSYRFMEARFGLAIPQVRRQILNCTYKNDKYFMVLAGYKHYYYLLYLRLLTEAGYIK